MKHFYCRILGIYKIFFCLNAGLTFCVSRPLFSGPKTVQASVTLLEQLPVYSECSGSVVLYHDILPMLYLALESSMSQVRNRERINTL